MNDLKCGDMITIQMGKDKLDARFWFQLKWFPDRSYVHVDEKVTTPDGRVIDKAILYLVRNDEIAFVRRPAEYYWQGV